MGARRAFVGATLGGLAGLWLARRAAPWAPARPAVLRALAPAFADPHAMAEVGALYLAAHPAEADAAVLARALCAAGAGFDPSGLVRQIAGDWREQRTVAILGWVFARTEARLCAWMHLEGNAP
jgi:hypothetical protein